MRKITHLAQDKNGDVFTYIEEPYPFLKWNEWLGACGFPLSEGKENPEWQNTLIDLEKDDYDFDDGILIRIKK